MYFRMSFPFWVLMWITVTAWGIALYFGPVRTHAPGFFGELKRSRVSYAEVNHRLVANMINHLPCFVVSFFSFRALPCHGMR
jgi:hypothetical protein